MGLNYLTTLRTRHCVKRNISELRHWSHVLSDVVSDVWFYTDELTFLPNRKAYDLYERLPVQVWIDVKDLYRINAQFGERVGDEVLWRIARSLEAHAPYPYRIFADKFVVEFDTVTEARILVKRCRESLWKQPIPILNTPGQSARTIPIICRWGTGSTAGEAEAVVNAAKQERPPEQS
jgi:GGDEF domain-containing protein